MRLFSRRRSRLHVIDVDAARRDQTDQFRHVDRVPEAVGVQEGLASGTIQPSLNIDLEGPPLRDQPRAP